MKARRNGQRGQSIMEVVLPLPLLLILLAGGYWAFRHLDLSGSAESASHAHMLRTGRNLPSISSRLSPTVHPGDNTVHMYTGTTPMAGRLPLFRSLSGKTVASVTVSCPKEPVGGFIDLPDHGIRREAEGAVDCWGKNTKSGSTIRRTVRGIVLSGVFR